jgi:hypothetical protein
LPLLKKIFNRLISQNLTHSQHSQTTPTTTPTLPNNTDNFNFNFNNNNTNKQYTINNKQLGQQGKPLHLELHPKFGGASR